MCSFIHSTNIQHFLNASTILGTKIPINEIHRTLSLKLVSQCDFSTLAPLTFEAGQFFVVGSTPMHCRSFSSLPGLNPLDASTPSFHMTTICLLTLTRVSQRTKWSLIENHCSKDKEKKMNKGWGVETDWKFGIDMYTLLYLKQITNKDLLYSKGMLLNIL